MRMSALTGWSYWSVDVQMAFLKAYLDNEDTVLVKPPKVLTTSEADPEESLWSVREELLRFMASANAQAQAPRRGFREDSYKGT